MNVNKIQQMDKQLEKLKRFYEQFVGVQAQIIDLAVLCHMSALKLDQKRGINCQFYTKLATFNNERTRERGEPSIIGR